MLIIYVFMPHDVMMKQLAFTSTLKEIGVIGVVFIIYLWDL